MAHLELPALESGLDDIRRAPKDDGRLEMIVRRPVVEEREVVDEGHLDAVEGLTGDSWRTRGSKATDDGSAHPDMQITLMNARSAAVIAGERDRWPLAGDQLFVDFDLSEANLPAGTRLAIGSAVIEITAEPHTGCGKFADRFGADAVAFVNATRHRHLHLRGVNARVVQAGTIRAGDRVAKI